MEDRHLYRGQRVDNGEFVVGYYQYSKYDIPEVLAHSILVEDNQGWSDYTVIPETVGQCTNKKANDINIYDGDILQSYHYTEAIGKKHYLKHRVVWSDRLCGWFVFNMYNETEIPTNGDLQLYVYLKNAKELEICGSIHDKE